MLHERETLTRHLYEIGQELKNKIETYFNRP